MKASETQVGGNWYKDMPRCYQPIIMSDALGLTPWEYNVLKRLLRHRTAYGAKDLNKAIHDLQLGLELEYPKGKRRVAKRRVAKKGAN